MNITPLEIRQKTFEKAFRGLDKDEVTAFLNSLSVEWERLNDRCKELAYKLESAENEVKKLREVENSLFKTLKTAEDTGANMIEQATKTAELHMKETEMKADALMSEAKSRARSIIEEAENKSRMVIDDMEDEIRQLEQVFRSMDANKVSLMSDLKMLAEDILTKIGRHEDFPADIKPHLKKAKEVSREIGDNHQGIDVESILVENEHKEAEASIDEMVEEPTDVADDLFQDAGSETLNRAQQESPATQDDHNSDFESQGPAESEISTTPEDKPELSAEEEEKERGSFFDQFD